MPRGLSPTAATWMAMWLAAVLFASVAWARPPAGTGDAWVDATLADVDRYAARYPEAFSDELVRYHDAPRALLAQLDASGHWTAGDVYFACVLAQAAGQPCRRVVEQRDRSPDADWNTIATGFGVAAGSQKFQQVKRALVHSYARWARPLQVDASLHGEFPQLPLAPPIPATRAATPTPSPATTPPRHPRAHRAPVPAARPHGGAA